MAKKDIDTPHPTTEATVASSTPAAGQSGPAAPGGEAVTGRRFVVRETAESGPVKFFAGIAIVDGVGYCHLPGSAYACVMAGYDVTDRETGKLYDGTKPAGKPVNA